MIWYDEIAVKCINCINKSLLKKCELNTDILTDGLSDS